jgi:hypothetical protein
MRSYLELHRTHYHYLFDNKALDQGSGSWLAMSTNDRYVPFFVEDPSILGDKSTLFSILVEVLADEESSVGARAPLSASV